MSCTVIGCLSFFHSLHHLFQFWMSHTCEVSRQVRPRSPARTALHPEPIRHLILRLHQPDTCTWVCLMMTPSQRDSPHVSCGSKLRCVQALRALKTRPASGPFGPLTRTVEHQPRGVNMVSAMVTVMTRVFFFDTDWPQVKSLRPGRRWNRLPNDSSFRDACEPLSLNSATAFQKASVVHLLSEVLSCKLCPGFVSRPGLAAKHMSENTLQMGTACASC